MGFTYTTGIPNPPSAPSTNVGDMQTNTNTISSWVAVDHVGFNNTLGGTHNKSTYNALLADPTTSVTQGAVYTKTVGSDIELFYRHKSNGTVVQITNASGLVNVPTILSGTFSSTGSFTNIVLLPANVYGYIIFMRASSSRAVQMSPFFTDATTAYGMSTRVVKNGSSNDDPVELNNNNSGSLQLQGRTDDFGNQTYDWRLHYWSL